jgi:hypothetical protein
MTWDDQFGFFSEKGIRMKFVVLILMMVVVTGCAGGIGRPGSPAWILSVPDDVKYNYYKGQCVQKGIKLNTPEMDVCIASKPTPRDNRLRTNCTMVGNSMICN